MSLSLHSNTAERRNSLKDTLQIQKCTVYTQNIGKYINVVQVQKTGSNTDRPEVAHMTMETVSRGQ